MFTESLFFQTRYDDMPLAGAIHQQSDRALYDAIAPQDKQRISKIHKNLL
jgi:hypothetical protein